VDNSFERLYQEAEVRRLRQTVQEEEERKNGFPFSPTLINNPMYDYLVSR